MSEPRSRARSTSVVWPLLLIGFGALMLLWRWLPNFYPWGVIGKYWPLLFICIGAGMILGSHPLAIHLYRAPSISYRLYNRHACVHRRYCALDPSRSLLLPSVSP